MGTPGMIPYECLEMGGSISRFHQRWHDVYDGMRPSAKTALVRPDPLMEPEARRREAVTEFRGIYLVLPWPYRPDPRRVPFLRLEAGCRPTVDDVGTGPVWPARKGVRSRRDRPSVSCIRLIRARTNGVDPMDRRSGLPRPRAISHSRCRIRGCSRPSRRGRTCDCEVAETILGSRSRYGMGFSEWPE